MIKDKKLKLLNGLYVKGGKKEKGKKNESDEEKRK